jgi:LuxR family quorum-sensing system transcriptional regulator CciR
VDYFSLVQEFVQTVKAAKDLPAVHGVLGEATHAFKFDHFALLQRIGRRPNSRPVQLSDYPTNWVEMLVQSQFIVHDPVLAACERTVAAFAWEDLPAILTLTKQQSQYMALAREQGLGAGFTVPIHVPGEATGLCSFVVAEPGSIPRASLPAVQYLACFAFEAARRLSTEPRANSGNLPKLTTRQLECLVLAAKGKSNWVVGELLGLSQQTVHKYLESAKRRYNVSTRTELIIRALFDGQVTFSDVIP